MNEALRSYQSSKSGRSEGGGAMLSGSRGLTLQGLLSLHQSLPPWPLAPPPCGCSLVSRQLPKFGQKNLNQAEEKLSLPVFPS